MSGPPGWDRLGEPEHDRWLEAEGERLLEFSRAARHPDGGFAWLDDCGRPDLHAPLLLWITCRMTHVHALAHLLDRPGSARLVDHGLAALTGRFRDAEHGGWFAEVDLDGPVQTSKTAYEHAFVVLAASSATAAGRPGARSLLDEAVTVLLEHFWDEEAGMVVEEWDRTWSSLDDYRGANSNMHTVEALLAAADVLGDESLRDRALRILTRVVHHETAAHGWLLPEHHDSTWTPLPDYNADEPAHPFRPFGATLGHSLEWARLALHLHAARAGSAPAWLVEDARSLFATAVRHGWSAGGVDGADGFVYTVDWDGSPVVRERMHWVMAEAIATAAALHRATGEESYAEQYAAWWRHVDHRFRDVERGSWHHELSAANEPSSLTWRGKPDVYHAFQATLLPRLPLAPSLATALAARRGRGPVRS